MSLISALIVNAVGGMYIDNIGRFDTTKAIPLYPAGFLLIAEPGAGGTFASLPQWAVGQNPQINMIWNGDSPATFYTPVAEPTDNPPGNMIEAFARIDVSAEALAAAQAAYDADVAAAKALVPTT